MRNNLLLAILVLIALSFLPVRAMGQTPEAQRRVEGEKRKALEETELKILKGENRLVYEYGGWINYRYDEYNNDDNDSSTTDTIDYEQSLDSRLWLKATLKPPAGASYANEHSIYIRVKDLGIQRRPDDTGGGYDHDGPHLDYAYAVLDFRPLWLEAGRRYFSVGQGISYSNVNDGVELYGLFQDWNLRSFIAQTIPHEDNVDTSVPGWKKGSDRTYYALEATYLGIPDHGLYGYILIQQDKSNAEPQDPPHNYTYNSGYFGLGSQGKLTPRMHYWVEIIKETGRSHIYDTTEKKRIDAWAGDFGVSYDWEVYSHPNFSIEYAFGSGDSSRTNVTNTLSGNTSRVDNNFLYFGYLPAGYAFSGRLSNLHFYKLGALFKPLEKHHFFRNLTLGIDYYKYYKDEKAGGIYDTDATLNSYDIGREIDLNISWQVLSDLSWSFQYGYFGPGKAYPDSADTPETYLSISTTVTF